MPHLYNLASWRRLRKLHLQVNPLCVMCEQDGIIHEATVVDHITPHRGDLNLFLDPFNFQSLCKEHHDKVKKLFEETGLILGCSLTGEPIDSNHLWNQGGDDKN